MGEIADTTLSLDLDEQKQLYASLEIPEYWVIDVKGMRLFGFGLTAMGLYEPIQVSWVLTGLPIALVEQTLERLATETNTAAANWLMQQLRTKFSTDNTESSADKYQCIDNFSSTKCHSERSEESQSPAKV